MQHVFRDEKYNDERFGIASIRFLIKSRKIVCSGKIRCSSLSNQMFHFWTMCSAEICSTKLDSAKSAGSEFPEVRAIQAK
jgi:hypothetical protein